MEKFVHNKNVFLAKKNTILSTIKILNAISVFFMLHAWEVMSHLLKKATGERAIRPQRSFCVHRKVPACNIICLTYRGGINS
jgi:hypothetical protein